MTRKTLRTLVLTLAAAAVLVLLPASANAVPDLQGQALTPAFPSKGAFVLGDSTVHAASPSDTLTWWSHSWWKLNDLTGGPVSPSFKGFATDFSSPTPTCGDTWTSTPGNSGHPPDTVPPYMLVLVSSAITKSGDTISGDIVKVVVVATDPGYGPDPGHPGTGRIVATICGGGTL